MDTSVTGLPPQRFDWGALVDKINTAAPAAGIREAAFDAAAGNVTLSVGEGGAARQITVSVPQIDGPNSLDEGEFASLVSKLTSDPAFALTEEQAASLQGAYAALAATPLPEQTGAVLFDLYALIALMLEAAQAQRDAARDIRQAENQAIQTAIQNQADAQRSAALTGMIAGLAVCAIQVVAQGASMIKSSQGNAAQMKALKESGVGPAEKQVDAMQAKFDTAQAKYTEQVGSLRGHADAKQTAVEARQTAVEARQTAVESRQTNLEAANAKVASRQSAADRAQADLDAAPAESRAEAQSRLDAAKGDLESAQAEQRTAQSELKTAQDDLAAAQQELSTAQGELKAARDNLAAAEKGPLKQEMDAAAADLHEAQTRAESAQNTYRTDERRIQGEYQANKWHSIGDIFATVGNTAQGLVRGASDMLSAEATEMGAEQKEAEEGLEQIKDLFNQGQDVIRAVLSLAQAVLQAESQSMRDAIQA